jgi:hypothetical protein
MTAVNEEAETIGESGDSTPRIISIGHNCVTKFQVMRYFYFLKNTNGDLTSYRNQVFNPRDRSIEFDTNIFDWQTTPFSAVIRYIRQDFSDVLEREDLSIDHVCNAVINHHVGTSHKHAFESIGSVLNEEDIRRQYPSVRSKFEHLAEKFRLLLISDGPIIYVLFCRDLVPSTLQIAEFLWCLRRRNPRQIFHLAMVGTEGQFRKPFLKWFGGRVSWHTVAPSSKQGDFEWEGDDESWDRVVGRLLQLGEALRCGNRRSAGLMRRWVGPVGRPTTGERELLS